MVWQRLSNFLSACHTPPAAELHRQPEPNENPEPARQNRDQEVQNVIRGLAFGHHIAAALMAVFARLIGHHSTSFHIAPQNPHLQYRVRPCVLYTLENDFPIVSGSDARNAGHDVQSRGTNVVTRGFGFLSPINESTFSMADFSHGSPRVASSFSE